ncbi:MAG: CBS and ACT domain-containing protein [Deltaproteobacteria bacterium]|nr:CBS and ACT domain-containing protein [Deltaproteobacteria bacterium]
MLVKNWMNRNIITVDANESMLDAINLLKKHDMLTLPVMRNGELVGVVTDRDLKRASASDATTLEVHELMYILSKIKVKEIMSRPPVTVPFDYTLEETAEILLNNKISGVPVVDHAGQVVGTISQNELFRAMLSVTGLKKRGVQFAFELEDSPGSIKEVADVIREYGGRIASILSSYERAPEGRRNVYLRMYGVDREKLDELVAKLKKKAKVLYMVDHREDRREIY